MALPFVPGYPPSAARLLGRFLPPLADGVAAHYLERYSRPGDLVLDPFGQAPSVAVEALALGRRVLVSGLNPVSRLAVSLAVRPPAIAQLQSALTALGDAPTGRDPGQRLELQVRALYQTHCAECEAPATADFFEWDAELDAPVEKTYVCPRCGPRTSPADEADRHLARRYSRSGLDFHFLLDRVASAGDPDQPHVEEALNVYPPRTLAAIGAVLVKLERLSGDRDMRRLLAGLLIAALETATVLAQDRPRILSLPRRYREINFWLALESAVGLLAGSPSPDRAVPLATLLAQREPAIHAYAGTARELADQVPPGTCRLLLTAIPRPNQAFWALSAVWTAWLWGREAAEPLRALLRRRRFDWEWHSRVLHRLLSQVRPVLRRDARVVGLVPEAEPGFVMSTLTAAGAAGLSPEGAVLRADTAEAQVVWAAGGTPRSAPAADVGPGIARQALIDCLRARAEPTRWASLHFAASSALAEAHLLGATGSEADDAGVVAAANRAIEAEARHGGPFERLGASADSEATTGLWCLAESDRAAEPLSDRVEREVLRLLARASQPLDESEVQHAVCAAFPGVLTPGRALVAACLASYGERLDSGLWQLRAEDDPAAREREVAALYAGTAELGRRYGFRPAAAHPQVWEAPGQPRYEFAISAWANLGAFFPAEAAPDTRRYLVLPGGRAGLVEHKLRRDPRLRQALEAGTWQLVKFRQVRRVMAEADPERVALETALAGDPLEASQLPLLP